VTVRLTAEQVRRLRTCSQRLVPPSPLIGPTRGITDIDKSGHVR